MATYTPQAISKDGTAPTVRTAASGDKVKYDTGAHVRVTNASASSVDLTLAVPGNARWGAANADKVVTIAAAAVSVPVLLLADYIDPSDGLIPLAWESTANVTFTVERV